MGKSKDPFVWMVSGLQIRGAEGGLAEWSAQREEWKLVDTVSRDCLKHSVSESNTGDDPSEEVSSAIWMSNDSEANLPGVGAAYRHRLYGDFSSRGPPRRSWP